jgi:pyruvate formate lyase activating enzyme
MKEALYYEKTAGGDTACSLCPHNCRIKEGKRGICGVRENRGGVLYSLVYSRPCATHIDPIEKKPLYHFLPGSRSFSIGTAGCNLQCMHCQNWDLSRAKPENIPCPVVETDEIIRLAESHGCASISYTYNEPSVNFEYILETSQKARKKNIKNVMVTNGYISPEPLKDLYRYIDAANVDLKGFNDDFYKKICRAKLEPVLHTLSALPSMGVWIEITNLIIPGNNDSPDEIRGMCRWIRDNVGTEYPIHFTAFHPDYKMLDAPPTPMSILQQAREIALDEGIRYVYQGNVRAETPTACPSCGSVLIRRTVFHVDENRIVEGKCTCGAAIPGIWT